MLDRTFIKYLEDAIGDENASVALSALSKTPSTSIRLNPFKRAVPPPSFLDNFERVPWSKEGCILPKRPIFTLHPLFHAGCYYVQDSSSMFVGEVFRNVLENIKLEDDSQIVKVLDLCAAPGGKTTDLAASLRSKFGNRFILVANEYVRSRCGILADNIAIWGDPNVVVTNLDPLIFSHLYSYFDIILTDVPCSGEGMFRKDEDAVSQWSEDNVRKCVERQRKIISSVWDCLKDNAYLIYSTCTFNKYENDDNVEWISSNFDAEICNLCCHSDGIIKTKCGYSLVPGFVPGEGQYCACLKKISSKTASEVLNSKYSKCSKYVKEKFYQYSQLKKQNSQYSFLKDYFNEDVDLFIKEDTIFAVPQMISDEVKLLSEYLNAHSSRIYSFGVECAVTKYKDIIPSADLALSIIFNSDSYPSYDVDRMTALAFLHRDNVSLPSDIPLGYVLIRFKGLNLGFVKNLGNRCNNLHPKHRRILMNISADIVAES